MSKPVWVKLMLPSRLKRLSLSAWILISVIAGVFCGLFFGELCAPLELVSDIFIKLLQMTILPYVVVSLIKGFGSLSHSKARVLLHKAAVLLLLFWGIAYLVLFLLPLSFPSIQSASFFSTSLLEERPEVDFLNSYIPANPFFALTNNLVPAVVLFCISMGIALMGVEKKDTLLEGLDSVLEALVRVAKFVVGLTPIGVFAIAASTAGTMTIAQFFRLQVYFLSFNAAILLLTFWVLPMLVAVNTPIRYREIVGVSRAALLTAFATDSLFVALPLLIANCNELFERHKLDSDDTRTYADVLIPVAFNFPNVASLLKLLFILFAAWFTGNSLPVSQYPEFAAKGTLSMFGGAKTATPYMLDAFELPADMFQLYLVAGVINARSGSMLGAMCLLTFTIMAVSAVTGSLRIQWRRLGIAAASTSLLLIATLGGLRFWLAYSVKEMPGELATIEKMQLLRNHANVIVHREANSASLPKLDPPSSLERIRRHGTIRVGYVKDSLPYSFFNSHGELVGLDIDLVHLLAEETDCRVEFVPYKRAELTSKLNQGEFDFAVSGIPITTSEIASLRFTEPYLQVTWALIVPDHRRREFLTMESIMEINDLRIGVLPNSYFRKKLESAFPRARLVKIESPREFFEKGDGEVDVLLYDAEGGAAWTLLNPEYQVVIPKPVRIQHPLVFAVAYDNAELVEFLSQWIRLKKSNGAIDDLFNYWILGEGAEPKKPRWSVIRDVLGWVE